MVSEDCPGCYFIENQEIIETAEELFNLPEMAYLNYYSNPGTMGDYALKDDGKVGGQVLILIMLQIQPQYPPSTYTEIHQPLRNFCNIKELVIKMLETSYNIRLNFSIVEDLNSFLQRELTRNA